MTSPFAPLVPPVRVLLGPGPSDVAPSVLRALAAPTFGHMDPATFEVMRELASMLRSIYETKNEWTLAVTGTGTSGMEASLANLIEPGDRVLVAVHGYFGARLVEIASRAGATVVHVEQEWGRPSDVAKLRAAAAGGKFKLVCAVHAETSTGVLQELAPLRALADELGALLLIDAVTSLGCIPIGVDRERVDAIYSCSQKGLSCTPGLSPVSFSPRAVEAIRARKSKCTSFYLDLDLLQRYWHGDHQYHHTASSNLYCGLHEAARLVLAEGLDARFERQHRMAKALWTGLTELGLALLVPEPQRLPQLTAVCIPPNVDDARVRKQLLDEFGLEIGAGFGPLKGKIWRIGLMGSGATPRNVLLCLSALRAVLVKEGFRAKSDPIEAAQSVLASAS